MKKPIAKVGNDPFEIDALQAEMNHFIDSLKTESDRGVALVSAAFLDETLKRLLCAQFNSTGTKSRTFINNLFGPSRPLGSFSSRINICQAFDLIPMWMAKDLDGIREIRNEFAHNLESATFSRPDIEEMVDRLVIFDSIVKQAVKEVSHQVKRDTLTLVSRRQRFHMACGKIGHFLQVRTVVIQSDKSQTEKRRLISDYESGWTPTL